MFSFCTTTTQITESARSFPERLSEKPCWLVILFITKLFLAVKSFTFNDTKCLSYTTKIIGRIDVMRTGILSYTNHHDAKSCYDSLSFSLSPTLSLSLLLSLSFALSLFCSFSLVLLLVLHFNLECLQTRASKLRAHCSWIMPRGHGSVVLYTDQPLQPIKLCDCNSFSDGLEVKVMQKKCL